MRRLYKIGILAAAATALVGGVAIVWILQAARHVPEFYREALELDPTEQELARDEFVAQLTALASDLHRTGHWQTLFTAEQINAWLALELNETYPEMLQGGLSDPRISIRANQATIACLYDDGKMTAVVSLTVDAYLQEPHVLALRIRGAHAGALPLPLAKILDGISHAARQLNLRLDWRKTHGDPVALISLPQPHASQSEALSLQTIELRQDELFVSGTIGELPDIVSPSRPVEGEQAAVEVTAAHPAVGSSEKETRQK